MKRKAVFFTTTLLMGLIIGLLIAVKLDIFPAAQSQETKQPAAAGVPAQGMENAVINVADTIGKAVVSISIEHTAKVGAGRGFFFNQPFGGGGQSPFPEDEFFRRFFDDFSGGGMPEREYKQMGLGSGVIIDKEGYILTNEHVIGEADKITVTLPDGREFKGEIKGKDSRSDLAIIKINAHDLPVVPLGDSDSLKIGQWVVAVGNPFGYALRNPEPTVTVGVISALHRSLGTVISRNRDYNDLIQTDAAINPGNSGGPLVNLDGEIVGINVAIFSTTGGYQGIGFAIPANNARRIVSRLIEGKKIAYGWLGITVQDLNDDLAKYFGLSDKNGILVARVLEDGPAKKAGIKESDIIKQFDDKPINNVGDLLNLVGKTEVGGRVKILVVRDKKEVTVTARIGERPESADGIEEEPSAAEGKASAQAWRGLEVEDLNSDIARRFRIKAETGVLIVKIDPNSPAGASGLGPGDIIVEINRQPVKNISDYNKVIKSVKGDILVKTLRGYYLIKEK